MSVAIPGLKSRAKSDARRAVKLSTVLSYTLLVILSLIFLTPFYLIFRNALLTQPQILSFDWVWLPIPAFLVEHPTAGTLRVLGSPMKLRDTPVTIRRPVPAAGSPSPSKPRARGPPASRCCTAPSPLARATPPLGPPRRPAPPPPRPRPPRASPTPSPSTEPRRTSQMKRNPRGPV